MSGTVTVFYGAVVTPVDLRCWKALPNCVICVGPYGNIESMTEHVERHELEEVLSAKGYLLSQVVTLEDGEFLIPGFIDTHTHAVQYPNLGTGGENQLLQWLEKVVFPREEQFKHASYAKKVFPEVIRRSLDFGTTTSCYYSSLHLDATKYLADFANELGQRAFIGKCNMDRKGESPKTYIEDNAVTSINDTWHIISYIRSLVPVSSHASIGTAPEPLVQPILTPRFAISCTEDCLDGLCDIADKYNSNHPDEPPMRIQTHISENTKEVEHTLELYPDASSYADVYKIHGVLRETTILAHAVHLTRPEINLIKEKNAGISHCPTSNFYLTSGIAPVGRFLDAGVKVGLGTDVGGGYAISMLNVIQNASAASKVLESIYRKDIVDPLPDKDTDDKPSASPPTTQSSTQSSEHTDSQFANTRFSVKTVFYLATLGGAEVCNLSSKVGSFALNKSFDALLVSVLDETGALGVWGQEVKMEGLPEVEKCEKLEENLERFLFCGDDRNIRKVYVQGRLVGGKLFQN